MISEHLNKNDLQRYHERTLEPRRASDVILHLARCSECMGVYRKMFPEVIEVDRRAGILPRDDGVEEPFHLDYDEHLEPYVNGQIHDIDREIVEGHIKTCGHCSAMLRDLQEFRELLEIENSRGEGSLRFWERVTTAVKSNFRMLTFAAGILLIIATGALVYNLIRDSENERLAEFVIPPIEDRSVQLANVPASDHLRPSEPENEPLKGKETEVANLAIPIFLEDLKAVRPGTLRGDAETREIEGVFPNGIVVRNTPTLRWHPVTGAASYEVVVFDQKDQKIGGNDAVAGTSWRPQNLRRGNIYKWQVTAQTKNAIRFIGQGKFYLTSETEEARIGRTSDSLTRAQALAESGLIREAEAELRKYLRSHPDSERARKYLRQMSVSK